MKWFFLGVLALMAVGFACVVAGALWYMSVGNREVGLRNKAAAVQKNSEIKFDNMWKVIAQVTEVADDAKEDFRTGWKDILSASDEKRGAIVNVTMNRINPKMDFSMRKKVQTIIESTRNEFKNNQELLTSIKQEHDDIRTKSPYKWVVGPVAALEINIVTSARTDDVFKRGQDDETSLRPKKAVEKK